MTIAEVSEKYDISSDTIRYYERIGLIPKIKRNKSGIRNFDEEDCRWIEFIKCMRGAGIPIRTGLQLSVHGSNPREAAGRSGRRIVPGVTVTGPDSAQRPGGVCPEPPDRPVEGRGCRGASQPVFLQLPERSDGH